MIYVIINGLEYEAEVENLPSYHYFFLFLLTDDEQKLIVKQLFPLNSQ